jgi:hypothetical protein
VVWGAGVVLGAAEGVTGGGEEWVVTGAAFVVGLVRGAAVVVASAWVVTGAAVVVCGGALRWCGLWWTGASFGVDAAAVLAVVVLVVECDLLEPPQPATATATATVVNSPLLTPAPVVAGTLAASGYRTPERTVRSGPAWRASMVPPTDER